ncbi:hypothetical protein PNK_1015 [Candidatus Protochlamydia naegleriophila]|uniref:Uncharacterized protein n=1 Tax=Candidatus Protochlamydia naegleriophila TaxID=389348 RepID=A0A0U5JB35_9BACT|nr:HAD family hydrolase [Candidatus Protochlamydia naegleriophila]CUI16638.1 hypothetical protein PNK_1015 [Candidatus Protochlamydia naegleriophila]
MVIVFDLDDTLYEELTFVFSGFKAVSIDLSPLIGIHSELIYEGLKKELEIKREKVFDRFLQKVGKYRQELVKRALSVYRSHSPTIHLYPTAEACLKRLQQHPLYIVTDGNKLVQKSKFLALKLAPFVKRCFFTYAHGLHRSKPSPYCFEKICRLEKVSPSRVVYIADNPNKDFVGIKPLGFQTIRVLTGPYSNVFIDEAHEAEVQIHSLNELDDKLLKRLEM